MKKEEIRDTSISLYQANKSIVNVKITFYVT